MVRGQRQRGAVRGVVATVFVALLAASLLAGPAEASFAALGYARYQYSPDGVTWQQPASAIPVNFRGVTYGNNLWVAVGSGGGIYTSANGMQWTQQTSGTTQQFWGVAYGEPNGNPLFVAVGPYNTAFVQAIYTSPNGVTWTAQPTALPYFSTIYSVAYGNVGGQGRFVAVGYGGVALTSNDGVAWMPQSTGAGTNILYGVTYGTVAGSPRFVAVGASGAIRTSPDGQAWTTQAPGTSALLQAVAFGNGLYTAVGSSGTILTSPDGIVWTQRSPGTTYLPQLYGVGYGNGRWVAVSNSMYPNTTSMGGYLITSTDAITWQSRPATGYYFYGPLAVAYGGGQWVAVGYYSIIRSLNGLDWISANPYSSFYQYGIASNGTHWVSAGFFYGSIYSSTDAQNWISRWPGVGCCYYFYGAAYGAGQWAVVGSNGAILTSPDTVTWTQRTSGTSQYLYDAVHGPGRWVAVGGGGTIVTSPDGVSWSTATSGTSQTLWRAAYGDGQYVAVGGSGTILTSPDGLTWTPRTSGTSQWLYGIAYGADAPGAKWVAVGGGGTILTSNDAVTWTPSASGTTQWLYGLARGDGLWVAAGGSTAFRSADASGGSWTAASMGGTTGWVYNIESNQQPPLSCAPATQIVGVSSPARVGATGGKWPYTWQAPGSNLPGPASGDAVTRTYSNVGNYTVTVTDSSSPPQTTQCLVQVSLTPPPPPPVTNQPGCGYQITTSADDPELYNWHEIDPAQGGGGTPVPPNFYYYNVYSVKPNPTFNFNLCGSQYSTFWLAAGGHICMDNSPNGGVFTYYWNMPNYCGYFYPMSLPNSAWYIPKPAVFGMWTILSPNFCAGGSQACLYYKVEGTAPNRVLIYEFNGVPLGYTTSSPPERFQIKLFEASSCIEVHYKSIANNPSYPWYPVGSGYQNGAGSLGYQRFLHASYTTFSYQQEAWRACPFSAKADAYTFNEDQPAQSFDVTTNDVGAGQEFDTVSWTQPTRGTLVRGPGRGTFSYQPLPDANGSDSFTYTIQAASGMTSTGTVTLTINAVNDPPSFEGDGTLIVASPGDGPQTIPGWGRALAEGPATAGDEKGQEIAFVVASNSNPGIFREPPTVRRTATSLTTTPTLPPTSGDYAMLEFAPSGGSGTSVVCFRPRDSGGTATVVNSWGVTATGSDTGPEQCVPILENAPPIAYFRPSSEKAAPRDLVTFDPCPEPAPFCTHDPDGVITTHLWEYGDGATSGTETGAHLYAAAGTYVVRLTVWDDRGVVAMHERPITVEVREAAAPESGGPAQVAPVADAGADRTVTEGSTVQLIGSQRGGPDSVAFLWQQVEGPPVQLAGQASAAPRFVAPRLPTMAPADLIFALTVADGAAVSEPDHVVVRVVSSNQAPLAEAGDEVHTWPGARVVLDASRSTDPDGDALSYSWEQVFQPGDVAVHLEGAGTATPSFTAPATPALLQFRLRASDGKTESADLVLVAVQPAAARPAPTFTFRVMPGGEGAEVRFEAGPGIEEAMWDFGDGSTGRGAIVLHRFAPGTYLVTMRTGEGLDAQSFQQQVDVSPVASGAAPASVGSWPWIGIALAAMGVLGIGLSTLLVRSLRRPKA